MLAFVPVQPKEVNQNCTYTSQNILVFSWQNYETECRVSDNCMSLQMEGLCLLSVMTPWWSRGFISFKCQQTSPPESGSNTTTWKACL